MQIRTLTGRDSESLYLFYRNLSDEVTELFRPFKRISREIFGKHLAEADAGEHITLGLFHNDTLVGHAFVMRLRDANPLFGIGVCKQYHGRGYGARLASYLIERCDSMGIENITLTVLKRNAKAIRMYRRLGFRVVSNHTYLEESDSFLMILKDSR